MPSPIGRPYICARCMRRLQPKPFAANTRSLSTNAPPPAPPPAPPSSGLAHLPHRRLLTIHGVDAAHFLQGLTTSNIPPLSSRVRKSTDGIYSAFLTAQGRVLHDVFIHPAASNTTFTSNLCGGAGLAEGEDAFFIDFDGAEEANILKHLKRYKLRSKIEIRPVDPAAWSVWSVWREDERWTPHAQETVCEVTGGISCVDARAPGMGQRVLVPAAESGGLNGLREELGEVDTLAYEVRRMLRGVPEGQREIVREHALPQESNMDFMGAIDFRKGCYLGQELTIRTHHTGVVRKRMLPVMLYDSADSEPTSLSYDPDFRMESGESAGDLPSMSDMKPAAKKGRSAGKFVAGVGNIGLALARIELMTDVALTGEGTSWTPESKFKIAWEGEENSAREVYVKAFMPEWIRSKIKVKTPNQRV